MFKKQRGASIASKSQIHEIHMSFDCFVVQQSINAWITPQNLPNIGPPQLLSRSGFRYKSSVNTTSSLSSTSSGGYHTCDFTSHKKRETVWKCDKVRYIWVHERHASLRFIEFGSFCPLASATQEIYKPLGRIPSKVKATSDLTLNNIEGWITRTCRIMRGHCTERLKAKSTTAHTLGLSSRLAHCIL